MGTILCMHMVYLCVHIYIYILSVYCVCMYVYIYIYVVYECMYTLCIVHV